MRAICPALIKPNFITSSKFNKRCKSWGSTVCRTWHVSISFPFSPHILCRTLLKHPKSVDCLMWRTKVQIRKTQPENLCLLCGQMERNVYALLTRQSRTPQRGGPPNQLYTVTLPYRMFAWRIQQYDPWNLQEILPNYVWFHPVVE